MMVTAFELVGGLTLDLLLGDPRWLPHPIAGIGRMASLTERLTRALPLSPRAAGIVSWCAVTAIVCGIVHASLQWIPSPFIQIYWIFSFVALRSLDRHAMAVIVPLGEGRLQAARDAASLIVGRDTALLDEREVARATVETAAENLSDGVIAPLFWLLIGGPVAMAAYKAINTMDSMFGHKNERYLKFGWCAARMDDLANWLPARLTAVLIWMIAALWPGMSLFNSVRATFRDAHRQPSPNSGYPEAAAAGALCVQLGGTNVYRGVIARKEFLGEDIRPLTWQTYAHMRVLLYGTTVLFGGAALGGLPWL
ncbi:MAG: cobalamin biosynthesis protein CobD [Acidobacteria bacterium]|nr:cobalamin biosynthesis protein CobD [Acidobacteriota bacterium]